MQKRGVPARTSLRARPKGLAGENFAAIEPVRTNLRARPKVGGDWATWLEGAAASAAHSPAASAGEATAKTAARAVGTR